MIDFSHCNVNASMATCIDLGVLTGLPSLIVGIAFTLRGHEAMLQNFFWRNTAVWARAKHLVKQVNKLSVASPLIPCEIVAFPQALQQRI